MNKNITRYPRHLVVIIALLGLVSCYKIIDISIPDEERKMVVSGMIHPNEPVRILLSKSLSIMERDTILPVSGALVNLYSGNTLIGTLQEETGGFYTLPGYAPKVGQSYRLTASGNGFKELEAKAFIPEPVPITSAVVGTVFSDSEKVGLWLSANIKDPAGIRNFYGLGLEVTYKEFDTVNMVYTGNKLTQTCQVSNFVDQFMEENSCNGGTKRYYEDTKFDGQIIDAAIIIIEDFFSRSDTLWLNVILEQVDFSYYQFVHTFSDAENALSLFDEPVPLYSNIEGGLGYFSGSSISRFPLTICINDLLKSKTTDIPAGFRIVKK